MFVSHAGTTTSVARTGSVLSVTKICKYSLKYVTTAPGGSISSEENIHEPTTGRGNWRHDLQVLEDKPADTEDGNNILRHSQRTLGYRIGLVGLEATNQLLKRGLSG